jgi:hypothetical protein
MKKAEFEHGWSAVLAVQDPGIPCAVLHAALDTKH